MTCTYVDNFVGRRLDPFAIVGGGARSRVWCQIFADVLGRRIQQAKDPLQANARGAAFIALAGLGEIPFHDISGFMEYEGTFDSQPENKEMHDESFDAFLQI